MVLNFGLGKDNKVGKSKFFYVVNHNTITQRSMISWNNKEIFFKNKFFHLLEIKLWDASYLFTSAFKELCLLLKVIIFCEMYHNSLH